MLIYNEIMTPFPWYDNQLKQNRFKKNCDAICDYKLISPNDALLPFMFRKPKTGDPTSWQIVNVDKGNTVNLDANLDKIHTRAIEGLDYFYYDGSQLTMPSGGETPYVPLLLPIGFYQSIITFEAGPAQTSELFYIPGNAFAVGDASKEYLKLSWFNTYDLRPFYYSDKTADVPYFINTVYLDTFVTSRDPEVNVDTKKDGDDKAFPTFQKVTVNHLIHTFVPDFLKLALVIMGIHNTIKLISPGGVFYGDIDGLDTDIATEAPGCMSTVTIKFTQDLAVVNRSCSDGMVLD